jgi:hypothetical protein
MSYGFIKQKLIKLVLRRNIKEKNKARLVAKRYKQKFKVNYKKVFCKPSRRKIINRLVLYRKIHNPRLDY